MNSMIVIPPQENKTYYDHQRYVSGLSFRTKEECETKKRKKQSLTMTTKRKSKRKVRFLTDIDCLL